ncbi:MAG: transposase [bacterium]
MPRVARGLVDGFTYHVLNRGNGKQIVFHKDKDYAAFVTLMQEATIRIPISLYAYCLMPNHFHMVVMPHGGETLSVWMQWLMTSHVRRYHGHYGTSGHIWQGRFKSFIVKQDDHLLNVLRYVEANPVRAGMVTSAKNWQWSSHRLRIEGIQSSLLSALPVELPDNWVSLVNESFTQKDLEMLRKSVGRQTPYGDLLWQAEICGKLGLESTIRPRGRPEKK